MNSVQKLALLKLYHRDPVKFRRVVHALAVKHAVEAKKNAKAVKAQKAFLRDVQAIQDGARESLDGERSFYFARVGERQA